MKDIVRSVETLISTINLRIDPAISTEEFMEYNEKLPKGVEDITSGMEFESMDGTLSGPEGTRNLRVEVDHRFLSPAYAATKINLILNEIINKR